MREPERGSELNRPVGNSVCQPFLKWAGGKRWLAETLRPLFSVPFARYVEPFLGGGAVFFASCPPKAMLADLNGHLIETYRIVRDHPRDLIRVLSALSVDRSEFLRVRDSESEDAVERAARFIYLNRTAFNGLYRVNQQGKFNVPYGCKAGTRPCDTLAILRCSERLACADLLPSDFRTILGCIQFNDLIYIDPPYTVRHDTNGFRRYNECLFSWEDQQELAARCNRLAWAQQMIVISNALHEDVLALYDCRVFSAWRVTRSSRMAAKINHRGMASELLLVSKRLSSQASPSSGYLIKSYDSPFSGDGMTGESARDGE
jgi:DNA adenine methylase